MSAEIPVIASTVPVPDDLVSLLHHQIYWRSSKLTNEHIREWLNSQPMLRLHTLWTSELRQANADLRQALAERTAATVAMVGRQSFTRAQWDAVHGYLESRLADAGAELRRVEAERDEARGHRAGLIQRAEAAEEQRDRALADVRRLRAELERWKAQDDATSEALRGVRHFGEAYESAIGRLRAAVPDLPKLDAAVSHAVEYLEDGGLPDAFDGDVAVTDQAAALLMELVRIAAVRADRLDRLVALPDLPDVGPVTWKADTAQRFVTVAGGRVFRAQEDHRTHAALRLAVAAFLDREAEKRAAADTTREVAGDVYALAVALRDYDAPGVGTDGPDFNAYLADAQAVIDRRRASAQAIVDGAGDEAADAFSVDLDSGR